MRIGTVIEALRFERYQWARTRRTYIPETNGKQRALGVPSWSDKLFQEVIRLILDAYYEPHFSAHSHGFRTGRGCHTALGDVRTWTGTTWLFEGDIAQCFDRLDLEALGGILAEHINDGRFLRLIREMLHAAYLEEWRFNADDFVLGFIGPKAEAELIKNELDRFLREALKLELSEDKTLITHARSRAARFLGYEVIVKHNNRRLDHRGLRSLNGTIRL